MLVALEELVAGESVKEHSNCTRVHTKSPYQIVIHECEKCGEATVPTAAGGSNQPENLITNCSSCHKLLHEKKLNITAWQSQGVSTAK